MCLCIKSICRGDAMNPVEMIGDVFARYLEVSIDNNSEDGTARFMIDHLSPQQTVAIAEAVLNRSNLKGLVDLKLNRDYVGESGLPEDVLTTAPTTFYRNCICEKPILLVASTGDDEDQSLTELTRIGAEELKACPDHWVAAACDSLPVTDEHQKWWEKAIAGLCDLRIVSIERLAAYVVRTRRLIKTEGLPIGLALGQAMPALRFPKDSTLFDRIREGRRTHKSAWRSEFNRVYRKNACFLQKQTTSQLLLGEDDLRKSFKKVRDEIPEEHHGVIQNFIEASSGWNQEAYALANREWEDIRPLFDGLRRVKLNLGEATIAFYDERSPDLLSDDDQEYLELLAKRPRANDPTDEDQVFYESHRNEIKEDRKLRSAWDKFIFGRPRECADFIVGLAASIESLFNQTAEAKKRTLQIRCDSATKKDLRDLNINAGEYFAQRYAGVKTLLGPQVKWQVGKLFDFAELVREWRKSPKTGLNRSQAKAALQLRFILEVEAETLEGNTQTSSTQLIWQFDPDSVTSEFVGDWRRLREKALVQCQTELEPISSKGLFQAIDLSNVKTFVPSYDRNRGSFVSVYRKEKDLEVTWRQNIESALNHGLISKSIKQVLDEQFAAFAEEYVNAINGLSTVGLSEGALSKQASLYATLLSTICTCARGDSNRKLLLRPLLQIGSVSIGDADVTTVVVAPWHPLRMAAIAQKAKLVADLIKRLLSAEQVEFGDQRLYFKELVRELEHPFYPEVVVGWDDDEPKLLSTTDVVGDYSLHEPPVLSKKRISATNENPAPAASRVMELLHQYVNLHPHERSNLSLVMFNSDSSRLPQAVVDKMGALHDDDEDVHCQIILRHTEPRRLRSLYQEIVESTDDVDSYSASEATQDFLARLRIGILVDQAPPPDPKDGCPHDISFSQDVIARHAQLEWYRESYKPVPLDDLVPPRWSRRRPAAKDDLKSVVYLCCPVQSREGWAFLTAVTSFLKGDWDGDESSRLLPVRQLDFHDKETAQIFEETHNLANWVVNYDELLDRRQLQNQNVRIIRYKQSATQGRNLVISSKASSGLLRTMLQSRLRQLNLSLSDADYENLATKMIDDANSISGDLALRAAKRGRSAYELMGVVLSRFLIRNEFSSAQYFGWYFLDDYAEWLGQREEQIADLMIVSPEKTEEGELQLSIVVSEVKYIDEASLSKKKKESQKQLRDTVRRINDALFGNPDRLDRELWLARLADLVLDGVQFSAGQSIDVGKWRHSIRGGNCKIMLRGYSHVFVHSSEFDATDSFSIDEVDDCHQEVFARKELRDLVLAYWNDENPLDVRNRCLDFPPSQNPHVFKPPTSSTKNQTSGDKEAQSKTPEPDVRSQSESKPPVSTTEPVDGSTFVEKERPASKNQESVPISAEASDDLWAYQGLTTIVDRYAAEETYSSADNEWLKQIEFTARNALQQFHLQAKLKKSKMTPNAALLKFAGSKHMTVDQVNKRRSEFLTTHGLNIISVQPEPGTVSIGIARPEREVVDLALVWKQWSPKRTAGNQEIAIAVREDDGAILYLDPSSKHAPHTLVAGSTGSGKSVLVQNILLGIAATNTPAQANIILIDPKQGVDYFLFEGLPHLSGGLIVEEQQAINRLQSLVQEMDERYKRFRAAKANNITSYNRKCDDADRMPTIWLIHDEFAEWMLVEEYKEAVSATVQRLGVKARAAGIHLIFAAQRPDANVMPMQLRSNLGNRLILRVDGEGTSEIALGEKGAEKLLGKGHLLAKLEGETGLIYAQVPLASEEFSYAIIEAATGK
ncbi:MAG: DNA translocase FtsK [gamma proteobacterium symbiont of Ctena orbiculata]|nr:MAG: DNA translocase FtsK [gamma proteobacterium symbiont of Ctena orbiculata]